MLNSIFTQAGRILQSMSIQFKISWIFSLESVEVCQYRQTLVNPGYNEVFIQLTSSKDSSPDGCVCWRRGKRGTWQEHCETARKFTSLVASNKLQKLHGDESKNWVTESVTGMLASND